MSPSETFVNPYTFVPFPEIADPGGFRSAPAGHARCGPGRLGGRIDVELTARSPLLLRGVRRGEVRQSDRDGEVTLFPRRAFPGHGAEPVPFLPGSSLAGVVRSLHETIAGGCLRVFDEEFRPGYRDFPQGRDEEWTLAVVERVDGKGRPTAFRLCSEVAWAPATELARVLGGPERVVTGARVEVRNTKRVTYGQGGRGARQREVARNEVTWDHWLTSGDGWVVLVSDAGARRKRKSFWCAVGKVGRAGQAGDVVAAGVTDPAWEDYRHAVEGTNDVRNARANGELFPPEPVPKDVTYEFADGERLVGQRHEARPGLHPGQVLWVRKNQDDARGPVDGLALSNIWRHAGAYSAGERVPGELLPCERPDELCPTCRVFGSADTSGSDTPESRQHGYRGHLRFSDARPVGKVGLRVERLAPLGAPRPGAGQFYLRDNGTKPAVNATPLREWGSRADGGAAPRPLRGRKHYWLTGRHEERPLFRVGNRTWSSEMATTSEAADAGSRFAFSVHFDGLDEAEIGGLLAALCPGLLLGMAGAGDGIGYAVGGGRPFGFGTCTATVTALEVDDPRSRYSGGMAPDLTVEKAVEAFRARVDGGVRDTWPAVTAALTLDRVEPGTVWYPPEQAFEPSGPLRTRELQPEKVSLKFWKQSQGFQMRRDAYPLLPLPDVTGEDQSLPVSGRKDGEGGSGRPRPAENGTRGSGSATAGRRPAGGGRAVERDPAAGPQPGPESKPGPVPKPGPGPRPGPPPRGTGGHR